MHICLHIRITTPITSYTIQYVRKYILYISLINCQVSHKTPLLNVFYDELEIPYKQ